MMLCTSIPLISIFYHKVDKNNRLNFTSIERITSCKLFGIDTLEWPVTHIYKRANQLQIPTQADDNCQFHRLDCHDCGAQCMSPRWGQSWSIHVNSGMLDSIHTDRLLKMMAAMINKFSMLCTVTGMLKQPLLAWVLLDANHAFTA